jgi:hypothetical protein
MKNLKMLFLILGTIFLIAGIYFLLSQPTTIGINENLFLALSFGGFLSVSIFLILEKNTK